MSQFVIDQTTIASIGSRVDMVRTAPDYTSHRMSCKVYSRCGCGAGGTCSNSCVSGCAERGGCGPHGPR